jgi:predicted RNA binding protein YcfA (HicA-like mRNA interferase family)
MGNFRPIPTKCWILFLIHKGYTFDRIKSSHHQYTKKGSRSIPVWGDEKEIPALHIKTSCRTIGCTMEDAYQWIEANC